jgi:hypothetical protein
MKAISDKLKLILTAAVKKHNISDIATELGLTVQAVSGSLATIKKDNLATYEDKKLVLTTEGLAAIGVTIKKQKNNEIVAGIFNSVVVGDRLPTPEEKINIVNLIATTLNKTKVDARVYLYNHEKATGLRVVATPA